MCVFNFILCVSFVMFLLGYICKHVRLTCVFNKLANDDDDDVGYLCANFSLLWALCSRLRPDVRDRQTSV